MSKKIGICLCTMLLSVTLLGCSSKPKESKDVTLYVTRHGETMFNEQEKAQGWVDSPLTNKGIKSAKALGKEVKDITFANAYTSTSERAVDTAQFVLEQQDNVTLHYDKGLKEMNFGSLEAQPGELLWAKGIDYCFENGWKEFGGEDFQILGKRAMKSLDSIVKNEENQGENVFVSTHGMTILSILYEIDPKQADTLEAGIDNCSITEIRYHDGDYEIVRMNDTAYQKGK